MSTSKSNPNSGRNMAALKKAQAELQQARAENERIQQHSRTAVENLKKEWESVKSNKKRSRYTSGIPSLQLVSSDESSDTDIDKGNKKANEGEGEGNQDPVPKKIVTLEAQNKKVLKLLSRLPESPADGFAVSPFVEGIIRVQIPKKLNIPVFTKMYDGTSDPQDHVAQYMQRM